MKEFGEWEYHPVYGQYSRLVFGNIIKQNGKVISMEIVGREYGTAQI